jgi:hypothetical protein
VACAKQGKSRRLHAFDPISDNDDTRWSFELRQSEKSPGQAVLPRRVGSSVGSGGTFAGIEGKKSGSGGICIFFTINLMITVRLSS